MTNGDAATGLRLPHRKRLNARRQSESFDLQCGGLRYVATVSFFPEGDLGEIFLSSHKNGSAADTAARDAAITASIAFQHGADIETVRKALCRDGQGRANGPLGVALDRIAQMGSIKADAERMP